MPVTLVARSDAKALGSAPSEALLAGASGDALTAGAITTGAHGDAVECTV